MFAYGITPFTLETMKPFDKRAHEPIFMKALREEVENQVNRSPLHMHRVDYIG